MLRFTYHWKHETSGKEGISTVDVESKADFMHLVLHWNGYKLQLTNHNWFYWPSETPAQKVIEKKEWKFLEEAGVWYHREEWIDGDIISRLNHNRDLGVFS